MHEGAIKPPMPESPSEGVPSAIMRGCAAPADVQDALQRARRLFDRTLANWASDALQLRRAAGGRDAWCAADRRGAWRNRAA